MSARSFVTVVCGLASVGLLALTGGCTEKLDPASNDQGGGGAGASGGPGGQGPGGSGGQGGQGGNGGAGGTSPCLDSSEHDADFDIDLTTLCVVEKYTAPFEIGYALVPKWGRHGGPVTLAVSTTVEDEITVTRWSPSGATLVGSEIGPIDLLIADAGPFVAPAIVDLPLSSWSIVAYGVGFDSVGEIIALDGDMVEDRWSNVGFFDGAVVDDGTVERLLHTGLTELGDGDSGNSSPAVYAADYCAGPVLCPPTETVATWGEANGPVVTDALGNAFAINTSFSNGTQELRGFHAVVVAPEQGAAVGTPLATLDGYGSALAAIEPDAQDHGIVLFRPIDAAPEHVIAQLYSVSTDAVAAEGTPVTALTLADGAAEVSLMNDDAGRVWVGVLGTGETTFYVLARH